METLTYSHLLTDLDRTTPQDVEELHWTPPSSAWIRIVSTVMAISILSLSSGVFASSSIPARVQTNGSHLNVRSSPGGAVVDRLPNGAAITLTGRQVNGWLQLANGNYISSAWVHQGTSSGVGGSGGGSSTVSKPILKFGDRGAEVTRLQNSLKNRGVYKGPVTGYYGDLTEAAVRKFQTAKGLRVDGVAGPQTWVALGGQSPSSGGGAAKVATRGSYLNVRSGPSTDYPIVGTLNNGSPITIYATKPGWHKVGENRWVSSSWVRVS